MPFIINQFKKNTLKISFLTLFLCLTQFASAQYFVRKTDVVVQKQDGTALAFPWTSGMNNPQFSTADFDQNGTLDLFIFDRGGDKPIVLLNGGTPNQVDYTHAAAYEKNLPAELHDWAMLLDANCDGVADLFSATANNGLQFYTGYYQNSQLKFTSSNTQLTFSSNDSTIVVPVYDLPAIADINNDGDIDVLSFDDAGGYIQYYENQAIELGLSCGVQKFQRLSHCWGGFFEPGITNVLELDHCGGQQTPATDGRTRHPGSALLATDLDNDGDKEIILGDISFKNLVMATNTGTTTFANMTAVDAEFPSYNQPVDTYIFPASYLVDINNDGLKDMLVSPSARVQSEHYRCVWLYQNIGTPTIPNYQYVSDTFLVSQTIDVNRSAKPVFVDENNDGLLDIVVGNYGYGVDDNNLFVSQLALYRNVGTTTQPAFRLISRNWGNVQSQFALPRVAISPTFGDLDGDNDPDMLLGDADGYIHYFKNTPNADGSANMVLFQEQYAGIDVFQQTSPQLVDVDKDGLLDLLIGHHNGTLQYFRNNGTATVPNFQVTNNFFGKVDVRQLGSPTGHSTPQLALWNDNTFRLVVGSESGRIYMYTDIENNLALNSQFTPLSNDLSNLDVGAFAKPALADLNNDGAIDMVVGTYNGGLLYYQQSAIADALPNVPKSANIRIYPNPTNGQLTIELNNNFAPNTQVLIYDICGKLVLSETLSSAQNTHTLTLGHLPSGVYMLHLRNNGLNLVQKVVVR
jgi:hypothetical protein